jgi:hypothetical protein
MGGKSAFLLREKAARTKEVLASIGRGLREQYEAPTATLQALRRACEENRAVHHQRVEGQGCTPWAA